MTFDFLNAIEELRDHPEFNMKKFEEFIHNRFKIYYGAWKDYPTGENVSVVLCFIRCCFADTTEYLKLANEDMSVIANTSLVAGHHYNRFLERIQSILSRF